MLYEIDLESAYEIDGGALGGAVAGVIFGFCGGAVVGTVSMISSGSNDLNTVWKASTSSALFFGGLGTVLPV